ncbi:MAG: hypothetical protein WC003_03880 [Terrimicrobiaceae bacterium]
MTGALEWQFGGVLRTLPPMAAWGVLWVLAVAGLFLVVRLYRRTMRGLPPFARGVLTVFRAAIVLVILLCLANPVRVERRKTAASGNDALAVVVDRSASMSTPDYRGSTRLADAVRTWKRHESAAQEAFSKILYRRFSLAPSPAQSFDDAVKAGVPGNETHLFSSLRDTLATSPTAVVCLTDGLDTTTEKADDLVGEALRRGVPLYFVTGKNRARASETLNIRAISAPPKVLRKTKFTVTVLVQAGVARDGELPVGLWSGEEKLAEARLPLHAGLNTLTWPVPVTSAEAGILPLEFRAGEGDRQESASCTTRVVEHTDIDVLYYQGAFQWGYRFLLASLHGDPGFRLTAILNPALQVQGTAVPVPQTAPRDLPGSAEDLKRFQIVVLAHVFADQLSPKQQQALVDYAKNGGSVLFIAPDSQAARRFAGTPLEQMLPIIFDPPKQESPDDLAEKQFQLHMASIGGANNREDTRFANSAPQQQESPELQAFVVPDGKAAGSKLFQPGPDAPRFSEYTEVRSVKPGAEIIAVHPRDRVPGSNAPRVLVARQQFGEGFTAAMTTDLLWRWKMSLPSTSHTSEIFWQQLLLSLAQPVPGQGLRLIKTADAARVGQRVTIQVESPADLRPEVVAVSPQGVRKPVPVNAATEVGKPQLAGFVPDSEGKWEVVAGNADGDRARITLTVSTRDQTLETSNLPPDADGLRRIAEATGGALIDTEDATVFRLRAGEDRESPLKSMPLWNSSWLLALLLGVYGAELITRRLFRLL